MNSAREKQVSELIAELCDRRIQPDDHLRLTKLLRDDPILQHEYLDQATIEGLLRYEFGGDRPPIPDRAVAATFKKKLVKPGRRWLVAMLVLLMGASSFAWLKSTSRSEVLVDLINVSFESDLPISREPILGGWYGDEARIVSGTEGNFAPHGKRMLQFVRSVHQPAKECEIFQVLDLSQPGIKNWKRPAFIEAAVFVNARAKSAETAYVLSLELYTYADISEMRPTLLPDSLSSDVMVSGKTVAADADPNSWQEIKLVMPLSQGTNFGIVKISVQDVSSVADEEFSGVFVDNVQVRLKSNGFL